jgi:hypothetical protein
MLPPSLPCDHILVSPNANRAESKYFWFQALTEDILSLQHLPRACGCNTFQLPIFKGPVQHIAAAATG